MRRAANRLGFNIVAQSRRTAALPLGSFELRVRVNMVEHAVYMIAERYLTPEAHVPVLSCVPHQVLALARMKDLEQRI